jgi:hypothetical protein
VRVGYVYDSGKSDEITSVSRDATWRTIHIRGLIHARPQYQKTLDALEQLEQAYPYLTRAEESDTEAATMTNEAPETK